LADPATDRNRKRMSDTVIISSKPRPSSWSIALAFALVYISWGTTYLAIKEGVKTLPPGLFGGVRVVLAGLILLIFLWFRRERLWLTGWDWMWAAVIGVLFFAVGSYCIAVGEKTVPSGTASVLVATVPLWLGLLEMLWPQGERLTLRGWSGLVLGLGGVILLYGAGAPLVDWGPLLVLASAFAWAFGSLILRHRRRGGAGMAEVAYQMIIGGCVLTLLGLCTGEASEVTADSFTPVAIWAFFHLLIVGSLVGYLAYTWLLGHVSATLAGTYAYVNPLVAILMGWVLGGEELTLWIIGGMVVILAGVTLVRSGSRRILDVPVVTNRRVAQASLRFAPAESVEARERRDGLIPHTGPRSP
jgi:drug/metabolite transporter (DMT)-like permease